MTNKITENYIQQ